MKTTYKTSEALAIADSLDCIGMSPKASAEIRRLYALTINQENQIKALEALRPHWAKGYTDDSMAAQASISALAQLWEILGASDQTDACTKARAMTKALGE